MYASLSLMVHLLAKDALASYKAHLKVAGMEDTSGVKLTGRWIVHSGIYGSSDDDPAFIFEVVDSGEAAWIDGVGIFMGDSLDEYWNGAR